MRCGVLTVTVYGASLFGYSMIFSSYMFQLVHALLLTLLQGLKINEWKFLANNGYIASFALSDFFSQVSMHAWAWTKTPHVLNVVHDVT